MIVDFLTFVKFLEKRNNRGYFTVVVATVT